MIVCAYTAFPQSADYMSAPLRQLDQPGSGGKSSPRRTTTELALVPAAEGLPTGRRRTAMSDTPGKNPWDEVVSTDSIAEPSMGMDVLVVWGMGYGVRVWI